MTWDPVHLRYGRIETMPPGWPTPDENAPWSPFSVAWDQTAVELCDELRAIGVHEARILLDVKPGAITNAGGLKPGTRVGYRGAIVVFDHPDVGTLTYSCDKYDSQHKGKSAEAWQVNVRCIALGLHDLRRLERYGIANRGQQYAGFAELGSGIAMPEAMTPDRARRLIADAAECALPANAPLSWWRSRYRDAAKLTHPDQGGDPEQFKLVTEAWTVLSGSDAS